MRISLIRHFRAPGNAGKRYLGKTDEDILPAERSAPRPAYPVCDMVFSSTLKRALSTARLIYSGREIEVIDLLTELDFGDFEGKTSGELKGERSYLDFLDGAAGVPNGENLEGFKKRCVKGFLKAAGRLAGKGAESGAIVTHGGPIMAIMERFSASKNAFRHYQTGNGKGYLVEYDAVKNAFITEKELL